MIVMMLIVMMIVTLNLIFYMMRPTESLLPVCASDIIVCAVCWVAWML